MLKNILHTGLTVPNLKKAIKLYENLGFKVVNKFEKPKPKAQVAVVQNGEAVYELWKFQDTTHPHVQFMSNHVAILSDSLQVDVDELIRQGYKLTIPITEGVTLKYAFVQDPAGTNYEIATKK